MRIEELRSYLRSDHQVCESAPYGRQTFVYKKDDEVFALLSHMDLPPHLTLKCDPDHALILRGIYPAVKASTFMNRRHWNTIALDGGLDDETIESLIDVAYALVGPSDCSGFPMNGS